MTGLGTPLEMKSYIENGPSPDGILWNPARTGYIAAYAAVELASKAITDATGQTFTAGGRELRRAVMAKGGSARAWAR